MTAVRASVTVNKNEDGIGEKMAKVVFIFISALSFKYSRKRFNTNALITARTWLW